MSDAAPPRPGDAPVLRAQGLTVHYGRGGAVEALVDVTFDDRAVCGGTGRILGLLGANGAGKSTLLHLIAGLRRPDRGTVEVAGRPAHSRAARRLVGFLPADAPLPADVTPAECLAFVADLRGAPAAAVASSCRRLDLDEVLGTPIGALSRGFRQRVGLAAALVCRPVLAVLDEPTAGLDPAQVEHFGAYLRDAAAETTVILSTHDTAIAAALCDGLIVLDRGRVVARGPLQALRGATLPAGFAGLASAPPEDAA